jgi:DNA-binding NarL/FixJ family response regulator
MIRLLLADDHAIVRGGLKQIFALQPDLAVTGEAINGAEVLECLRHGAFDLLLLDLNMDGISGVDLIARVKARQPELPVLVLSMHNEASVAARMLKAGASGYTSKDCEPAILLAAIRKVAAGGRYIAPEIAEKMVFEATTASSVQLPHHQLTSREMLVFRLLTRGLGVTEIAAQLAISSKTVSTHKASMLEKLKLGSIAQLMRYAMEHDLLQPSD